MKIKPDNNSYKILNEQIKQKLSKSATEAKAKIKEAGDYLEPKVKDAASKAADWTDEKIKDAKEIYRNTKEKVEPKVSEFIDNVQYAMNPPKLDVLKKDITNLQKKYLFKSAYVNELQRKYPEQSMLIYANKKELQQLEKKTQEAVDKYNEFSALQAAAQKTFDTLNKNK